MGHLKGHYFFPRCGGASAEDGSSKGENLKIQIEKYFPYMETNIRATGRQEDQMKCGRWFFLEKSRIISQFPF